MKSQPTSPLVETSIDALEFSKIDAPLQTLHDFNKRCHSFFEDPEATLHYGVIECIDSYKSVRLVFNRFEQEERLFVTESNLRFDPATTRVKSATLAGVLYTV